MPPSSATPTSKEIRVRVEGFSKTSATERPARAPAPSPGLALLELGGALEQRRQRLWAIELLAGEKVRAHEAADTTRVQLKAMTWNVFHGRDWPPEPELQIRAHKGNFRRGPRRGTEYEQVNWDLIDEFAEMIAAVDWDVALFQEFPPSWKRHMARACEADAHRALSGRNWLQPLTSLIGRWRPDLLGAWEGGSNTTLVRPAAGEITERRRVTLTRRPELRVMALTRLELGRLRRKPARQHQALLGGGRAARRGRDRLRLGRRPRR